MIKILAFGILLIVSTAYAATTMVVDTVATVMKAEGKKRMSNEME